MKRTLTKAGTAILSALFMLLGFASCNPFRNIMPQPKEYGAPSHEYISDIDSMVVDNQSAADNGTESQR